MNIYRNDVVHNVSVTQRDVKSISTPKLPSRHATTTDSSIPYSESCLIAVGEWRPPIRSYLPHPPIHKAVRLVRGGPFCSVVGVHSSRTFSRDGRKCERTRAGDSPPGFFRLASNGWFSADRSRPKHDVDNGEGRLRQWTRRASLRCRSSLVKQALKYAAATLLR
jgi:hypothetical protein